MARYHIDIHGLPAVCPAKIQCRKTDSNGEPAKHFEGSVKDAQKWAEKENAREMGGNLTTKKKPHRGISDVEAKELGYEARDYISMRAGEDIRTPSEKAEDERIEKKNKSNAVAMDIVNSLKANESDDYKVRTTDEGTDNESYEIEFNNGDYLKVWNENIKGENYMFFSKHPYSYDNDQYDSRKDISLATEASVDNMNRYIDRAKEQSQNG